MTPTTALVVARERALLTLVAWYDAHRPSPQNEAERYVVCAGLAVLECLKTSFPLQRNDYVTPKNQVKTSGRFIQRLIEERLGPGPTYAREEGRTTRGTVPAAEALASSLNALQLGSLDAQDRILLTTTLQDWLIERVRNFYNRQHLTPDIDLGVAAAQIVASLLVEAQRRNVAGVVA